MSGRLTLWGAGEFLNMIFSRKVEIPSEYYLAAIQTLPPTPYLSGSELDEPDVASYSRLKIENTVTAFSNKGQIQVTMLSEDVQFAPALEDWGDIRYWALCNEVAEGYAYFVGTLETPVNIVEGDVLSVGAGDLGITLGPFYASEDS